MIRPLLIASIAIGALFFNSSSKAREWTQAATGKTVEAEFVKAADGVVTLRLPTGREARVPINALIARDQVIISELVLASESGGPYTWPSWRGPNRNGIAVGSGLKKNWDRDGAPERLWVFDKAGMGYSSFCIANNQLFSLGTRGTEIFVYAVNIETGKEVWATKIADDLPDETGYNTGWGNGPRSAPTFASGAIFALSPLGTLVALDANTGELKWDRDLIKDFEGKGPAWGFSESPTADGDKILVSPGGGADGGSIVALNKNTGELIWHSRGLTDSLKDNTQYATITPATIHDTKQYIQLFQNTLVGVDASTGERLWHTEWPKGRTAVIPTPIIEGNKIYVTSGYGAGAMLVEVMPNWNVRRIWANTVMKNHHGGVVKVDDHVYGFSEAAGLIAQDFSTGKMTWNQKSQFFEKGSVLVADGMIYTVNEKDGTVSLVEVDPAKFVHRGSFKMAPQSPNRNPKGAIWTHPVIAGGKLYLRDQEFIICYNLIGS